MQSIKNLEYQQCRTCYDSASNLQLLTTMADSSPLCANKTYAQLLLDVCNINIMDDKPLGRWPRFICLNCIRKLKAANEFIQHTLKINQLLQSIADLLQIRSESDFEKPALDIPLEIKLEEDFDCSSNERKFDYSPIEINGTTVEFSMQTNGLYDNFPSINNASKINKINNKINYNDNENLNGDIVLLNDDDMNGIPNNIDSEESNDSTVHICADDSLLTVAKPKSPKPSLTCLQCNKSFKQSYKLKQHQRWCNILKTYCEVCDQHFARPYNYKRHMGTVHKNGIITSQTPKKSIAENRKQITKQVQKIEKPIKTNNLYENTTCDICEKTFPALKGLIRHKRYSHLREEDKITCNYCGNKFARRDNYHSHLKRLHPEHYSSPETSFNKYSCSKCDCIYSRRTLLMKHEEEVHGK